MNHLTLNNTVKYRYSWDNTPLLVLSDIDQDMYFAVYLYHTIIN